MAYFSGLRYPLSGRESNLSVVGHDSDGCFLHSSGDLVLDNVEHVLIIQQANEMERAEACSATQRQITDHH